MATVGADKGSVLCNGCYSFLLSERESSGRSSDDNAPASTATAPELVREEVAQVVAVVLPDTPRPENKGLPEDEGLGEPYGIRLGGAAVRWSLPVRKDHVMNGCVPLPDVVAEHFEDAMVTKLRLEITHAGPAMLPDLAQQLVSVNRNGKDTVLTGVAWPAELPFGTRFSFTWDRGGKLCMSSTLLDVPVTVDGRKIQHAYDPRVLTRDSGPDRAVVRDADSMVLLTVRRLGLLDEGGRAMLPEKDLLRNVAELGGVSAVPTHKELRSSIHQLLKRKKLTLERGSRNAVGYLRHPARGGEEPVELLCYTPELRALTAKGSGGSARDRSVRGHKVAGHLMNIGHLGKEASEEAKAAYREDHSGAGLVGPHELPPGRTYVRPHRRGH